MPQPSTPIELKRKRGNPSHRPLPAVTDTIALPAATSIPEPPDDLGDRGVEVWNTVWRNCNQWISPATEYEYVHLYALQFDMLKELQACIVVDGYMLDGGKMNPAVIRMDAVLKTISSYASKLGLTPSDRSRLGLAEIKKASALEQFINGGSAAPVRK